MAAEVSGYAPSHGETCYSKHMEPSEKVLAMSRDTIIQAVENVLHDLPDKEKSFTIIDLGTADGGVSLDVINDIIDTINERTRHKQQITIVYEDQVHNDFNVLFKRLNGMIPETTNSIRKRENVHILASATNMYKQCLPSNSVHIALSTMAVQHLSKQPCNFKNGIFQEQADLDELTSFRQQFSADWFRFLQLRSKELAAGGRLIVIAFFEDSKKGRNSFIGDNCCYTIFSQLWKNMLTEGLITEAEFIGTTPAFYTPTKEELITLFNEHNHNKSLHLSLASFVSRHVTVMENCNSDEENVEGYKDRVMGCIKPWLFSVLFTSLSKDRTSEERTNIVDQYFSVLRNHISNSPIIYRVAEMVFVKTGSHDHVISNGVHNGVISS